MRVSSFIQVLKSLMSHICHYLTTEHFLCKYIHGRNACHLWHFDTRIINVCLHIILLFFDHFRKTIATTRLKSRRLLFFFLEQKPNSQGDRFCSRLCMCVRACMHRCRWYQKWWLKMNEWMDGWSHSVS